MQRLSSELLLESMRAIGRDVSAYDLTDYLFPDVDYRTRSLYCQRIRCRLNGMEGKGEVYRVAYINRVIMWSLHEPSGYIPRKKGAVADPYVLNRVYNAFRNNLDGLNYGELIEAAYGVGTEVDQYELIVLKRAIRELEMDGKIKQIDNPRNRLQRWRWCE